MNQKWKDSYLIKELQRHLPDASEDQLNSTIEKSHCLYEKLIEKIKLSKTRRILPDSFEESLSVKTEEYKALFPNDNVSYDGDEEQQIFINFRTLIESIELLTDSERRELFDLHNDAVYDEVYGKKLMQRCEELMNKGKMNKQTKQLILILSIDWPLQFKL